MKTVEITLKLPQQLIERARAIGLNIEEEIADIVEKEIRQREFRNPEFYRNQLAEMAADPYIQREIKAIQDEEAGIG